MIKYIYNEQETTEEDFINNLVDYRLGELSNEDIRQYDIHETFMDDIYTLVLFANTKHTISDEQGTYRIETDIDDLNLNMLLTILVLDRLEDL